MDPMVLEDCERKRRAIFPGPCAHVLIGHKRQNVEGGTLDTQAQTREPENAACCYLWDLLVIPPCEIVGRDHSMEEAHGHWFLPCFTSKSQFPYLRNG